jgi:hypothetical protein
MVNMSLWLSLSLTWLTFVVPVVTGLPYFYINSNRQRCVVATIAKDTIHRVHYEAPGPFSFLSGTRVVVVVVVVFVVALLTHCLLYHPVVV